MATFPGVLYDDPPRLLPSGVSPIRTLAGFGVFGPVDILQGPKTTLNQVPIYGNVSQACCLLHDHASNIYGHIWVIPSSVDLGSMTGETTNDIEVWNANYGESALSSVGETGTSGMALTQPSAPPLIYPPLVSHFYTVTVALSGPALIDAEFTFNFAAERPTLSLTGRRVLTWLLQPNWADKVTEKYEWLTDVIEAEDSTEQRSRLRTIPRRTIEYNTLAWRAARQKLDGLLWAWQSRPYLLPIWRVQSRLQTVAAAGSVTLSCDTSYNDFVSGGMVVVTDGLISEAAIMDSVSAGSVTLQSALQSTWAAGSEVYPARFGRLKELQEISAISADVIGLSLSFRIEDPVPRTGAELSADTYRGYPVLLQLPNWREGITLEYSRKLQEFDSQTNLWEVDDLSGMPSLSQSYHWLAKNRSEVSTLLDWLYARAGRWKMLWVPSFMPDVTIVDTVIASQSYYDISNISYSLTAAASLGRRDLLVVLHSGTAVIRRVIGATALSATVERLVVDSPIGIEFTPAEVIYACWMQLSRMSADSVEVTWLNPVVAECSHNMKGLNYDI